MIYIGSACMKSDAHVNYTPLLFSPRVLLSLFTLLVRLVGH